MFEHILVPLDGSELSSQILWQVRRVLLMQSAQVDLYTVVDPSFFGSGDSAQRLEDARRYLEEQQDKIADSGGSFTCEVELGDPADMILRRVEHSKPSLVAMATHGRSGPSRWLRGSVAQRVLRECKAPLLLVNPTALEKDDVLGIRLETILVPLDGSERSASILPLVRDLAKLFESQVVLLRVWPDTKAESAEARQAKLATLEPALSELLAAGVKARARAGFGYAPREILEAADAEGADLVTITTHGEAAGARWFAGSVTEKVLRRCALPLLIVNTRPSDESA